MDSLPPLSIAFQPRKPGQKSRTFSVRLLAYLCADDLWTPDPRLEADQPVWIAYHGTDQESRAFTANFRGGRCATALLGRYAISRKAGFRWVTQKVPRGVITVAYLPELFHLEPPLAARPIVQFLFAPPAWWIEEQAALLAADFGDDARDAARAALFGACPDRRTSLPLVHDLRFPPPAPPDRPRHRLAPSLDGSGGPRLPPPRLRRRGRRPRRPVRLSGRSRRPLDLHCPTDRHLPSPGETP